MTKRTVEEVQHQLQLLDDDSDHLDEDCLDDPDEPIMDGSDDEFRKMSVMQVTLMMIWILTPCQAAQLTRLPAPKEPLPAPKKPPPPTLQQLSQQPGQIK